MIPFHGDITSVSGWVSNAIARDSHFSRYIFRGESRSDWPLLPKAGRPEYCQVPGTHTTPSGLDMVLFGKWVSDSVAYCNSLPPLTLHQLAYAQHYGLATRLLDWTTNPLVALYFAVEQCLDLDGSIYALRRDHTNELKGDEIPHDIHRVSVLQTPPFDRRLQSQSGLFTYHPQPNAVFCPIDSDSPEPAFNGYDRQIGRFARFRVPAAAKSLLRSQLFMLGVHRANLFPDLEGLSAMINWNHGRYLSRLNQVQADGAAQ